MEKTCKLRRLLCFLVLSILMLGVSAQVPNMGTNTEIKTEQNAAKEDFSNVPKGIFMVQYQFLNLGHAKESGLYGFKDLISLEQNGKNHVCLSFGVSANYGISKTNGFLFSLGPAYRTDLSKTVSLSVPLELLCFVMSVDSYSNNGTYKSETDVSFGCQLGLNAIYMPGKVGMFIGPQFTYDGSIFAVGASAGLCF